ncbi:Spy/CpxP family protein refolding chaperone [Bradyrhizobium frederickii]|nr:Spy/CpxP family protein refolding chaperone [Bradyrhizobium frederickii]
MINPVPSARLHMRRCIALGAVLALLLGAAAVANAQGLVKGVQDGAAAGNKAAGPVGGVLGGAIGGVVGVFTGVLGVGNNNGGNPPPAAKESSKDAKQQGAAKDKDAKTAKGGKGAKASKEAKNAPQGKDNKDVTVLTQPGAPQQTAEQIVANSDSYIERIKTELNLTPEQEKHWYGFSSAMHYLGHNGAERLNLRVARAKRDPPDDIIEQMRNEAQFLIDRAADQRNVADAAEPLYSSLDDKQKQVFIQEMVRLSHERGLD